MAKCFVVRFLSLIDLDGTFEIYYASPEHFYSFAKKYNFNCYDFKKIVSLFKVSK